MAKCDKQLFSGVTEAQFAALVREGQAQGLPIHDETGQATVEGVTIAWTWDRVSATLAIECTDAPSFVPCSMINGKIDSVVSGVLARARQQG